MRIVNSDFKDYYDGVMYEGVDKSIIFDRKFSQYPYKDYGRRQVESYPSIITEFPSIIDIQTPNLKGFNYHSIKDEVVVLVANKMYCGIKLDVPQEDFTSRTKYLWSVEEAIEAAKEVRKREKDFYFYSGHSYSRYKTKDREKQEEKALEEYFNQPTSPKVEEYMIKHHLTIVSNESYSITINPRLANINFAKVLDPYTIFQEISMWVGGVLTKKEDPEPIPDKYKIEQFGFDPKWSFRKRSENVK